MKKIKLLIFLKEYVWYLPIFLTIPIFFYKLGQSSLVSFDEAWYGSIAKNILKSGDFLRLTFNGTPFFDHPPFGFWLMALSYKILGISEFSTRFVSAICGFLSLIVIFLLGKELFNKWVGLFSSLALTSSFWFLFRARSGNLDVILVFIFLLTIYLAVKSTFNKKYLIPSFLSLSFLFLTKTVVPLTILPVLLLIFFYKGNLKLKDLFIPTLIFLFIVGGYFLLMTITNPFFIRRYFYIGLTGVGKQSDLLGNLSIFKTYLHSGIGKWFWPGIASIFVGLLLRQKRFYILAAFAVSFSFMFLFSPKTQIWHLIPLHPILILAFIGLSFTLIEKLIKNKFLALIEFIFLFMIVSFVSFNQIKRSWYEFIDIPAFVSDEAILSREASKYKEDFYIDSDFIPTAAFYSEKTVSQTQNEALKTLFEEKNNFLVITYEWRLNDLKIPKSKYEIIKKDRDKILVRKIK